MTAAELRELSDTELTEKLDEAKQELFSLRFANVTGQLDNVRRLNEVRKDIARVLTVQRQRELQAASANESGSNES